MLSLRAPASQWLLTASMLAPLALGLTIDTTSIASVEAATSNVAWNMMLNYYGNQTANVPGNLPAPYYWWEAGGMFGHLIDYWYYTGDDTYNQEVIQAIVFQAGSGEQSGFMPTNQTSDEGNDDQVFWAFAALEAAELRFPSPSTGPVGWVENAPSWIAMAQAVFNLQNARWDPACGGGLRWQLTQLNSGWDYKNIASNGGFFQLAIRLARYTGNNTYLAAAEKEWNWIMTTPLIDQTTWQVNDGIGTDPDQCSVPNVQQFTYNYGIIIAGLAYAYNYTGDEKWMTPLTGILNAALTTFFPNGQKVMMEIICDESTNCGTGDAPSFKSFTARWLGVTAQLVPSLAAQIWPYIAASAVGAAGQCVGAITGESDVCGMWWNETTWDNTYGPGQQMSALAVMGANMLNLKTLDGPVSLKTGGTSKSDPSAGTGTVGGDLPTVYTAKITTSSKAGAGILTFMFLAAMLGGTFWLII